MTPGADRSALTPLGAGAPIGADVLVASLGLRADPPAGRPRVAAVFVSSLDGRGTLDGSSVGLSNPADRALFRALRAAADVSLVGPATLGNEYYAKLVDADAQAARVAAGLPPKPVIATITRSGRVPWHAGFFGEPDAGALVYSGVSVSPPGPVAAALEVVAGLTEPRAVIADLGRRAGAQVVVCEGGPTLLRALAAADLLDDLFLTLAPLLVSGDAPPVLAGPPLDPPQRLSLAGTWRGEDHLMLHFRRRD